MGLIPLSFKEAQIPVRDSQAGRISLSLKLMDEHFSKLFPGNTRWQESVLLAHNQARLNQGETFPFGSSGGRTIFRKPFSQWTTMH